MEEITNEVKRCETCQTPIPPEYVNLLCLDCYKHQEEEKVLKEQQKPALDTLDTLGTGFVPVNGVRDPNYKENPEAGDKEQWGANITMFQRNGVLLWKPTRGMYNFIKNYCLDRATKHPQYPKFIWKPKIVDVGCGIGVGSNVLSEEADFVWGIDKNLNSVKFAKEAFTRIKNGIYYSSQVTFDQIDITEDTREFMKFEVVVAIEIIEHIFDYKKFLTQIIKKFDKGNNPDPTIYFISTPNRNNKHIQQNQPLNKYHVREWTSEECWDVLSEFFKNIEFMSAAGVPTERTTLHTPILAKCWGAKI